jgi:Na+-transporting methylmalonyl-CoA/oxaloacetate decarboxylase gamma subunit
MQLLGIYQHLYGDTPMTVGRGLLIAAAGFLIVFAVLGLIALFVKGMGAIFDAAAKKKKAAPANAPTATAVTATASAAPAVPAGPALPENESAGTLVLTDVTEEEAALIMAIVSSRSGIPLNRLQFNSIRLLEDEA